MSSLEDRLAAVVRDTCREAVTDALEGVRPADPADPETWRSRVHTVHPDTRLSLADVAEALDVSTRSVRRYVAGEGEHPKLPAQKGPTGLTVRAGDLVTWLEDVEGANRFRRAARGRR